MKGLNQLAYEIHDRNIEKGFFDDKKNIGEMLMLMVTEVAEACEADRKDRYMGKEGNWLVDRISQIQFDDTFKIQYDTDVKGTFEEEMADIFIRLLDMCAFKKIDLNAHVELKMRYNSLRPHKHGKKY
jgi:NTP pyrophosphatase (non-canonical NTP hydrolase)